MQNRFKEVAANQNNPSWELLTKREQPIYGKKDDIRSDFARDYTRVLPSLANRRLKHKSIFQCSGK